MSCYVKLRKGFYSAQITVTLLNTHQIFIISSPAFIFIFSLAGSWLLTHFFTATSSLSQITKSSRELQTAGKDNLFRELLREEENNLQFPIWNTIRKTTDSWLTVFFPLEVCVGLWWGCNFLFHFSCSTTF